MTDTVTKRIGMGDRTAVVEVFDLYGEPLLYCAVGTTLDVPYAEHACEKLFVNLMELVRQQRPEDQGMRRLLFRSLQAEIEHTAKERRKAQRPVASGFLGAANPTLPESFVERTETMMHRLKEPERMILLYRSVGGLSLADLAEMSGERFDLIERRYNDAVKHAMEILKPPENEPQDIDLWIKRVKFKTPSGGLRHKAIEAFVTRRMSRKMSKKTIWVATLLFVLAGLAVGLKVLADLQVSWLKNFFSAP